MHLLRVAIRTLSRPSHRRFPLIFHRHFESETPVTGNAPPFAQTFRDNAHRAVQQDLIDSMNNSHRAMRKDLTAAHERQMLALQQELKSSWSEVTQARVDLVKNVSEHLLKIELLKMDLHKIRNEFNLRSAIEVVAYTLDERHKSLNLVNPAKGSGVQKVIDAVVRGGFDDRGSTFEKSKAIVIKARGGIKPAEVHDALRTLYSELSKDHHPGSSQILAVRHGKQTVPEAIAALSIVHFAQHAYGSNLDATYYNSNNKPQFTLSDL
ncbi:hypothetical protein GGX14DRAFT_619652 [Mycena pura]|uniref:Uncharacterized protein n=1 Tax=Mycena pura TaxID=153505 RepID=A0AAD6VID3_9AGAR|nr:hypothetical protein GGX14DRAFT_619652 [Mycena pura]